MAQLASCSMLAAQPYSTPLYLMELLSAVHHVLDFCASSRRGRCCKGLT